MRIVFILSTNFAGSHLLSSLLDGHPECAAVGELRNYRKLRRHTGPNAGGTESDYADHPLFAGLDEVRDAAWHQVLLERLRAQQPRVTTLIDNSKKTGWAKRSLLQAGTDVRLVHLLRDPRALVRRWREQNVGSDGLQRLRWREARRQPLSAPRLLLAPDIEVYVRKWMRANEDISRFVAAHQPGAPVVLYRELVEDTEPTLRWLMPRLGLDFDAEQLRLDRRRPLGTRKTAWMTDGHNAPLELDVRWRFDLSDFEQRRVDSIDDLHDYLDGLGLRMGSRGLERPSS